MEWRDEGILLSTARYGETALIIDTLTLEHGRVRGLVRGGAGRRYASTLQPGNELLLTWRARTADQLGSYNVELLRSHADSAMADREALAVLEALRSLVITLMPEREPTRIYGQTLAVLRTLDNRDARRVGYAKWELALLADLGFSLDLTKCAVSRSRSDLHYVSPRSGRAVSADEGAAYAPKLLPLPSFLNAEGIVPNQSEFAEALNLTGFFLRVWALNAIEKETLPDARQRLETLISKS